MPFERKEGDMIIFKNISDNPKAPAYKGKMLMNGEDWEVALWEKRGAKGPFLTGSAKPARQRSGGFHQGDNIDW